MARLGDVCTFYSGTGFPNEYQGSQIGEYPFYKVGDISKNVLSGNVHLKKCDNYIDKDTAKIINGTIIPSETVVFAKIGEALRLNRRAITTCDCLIDNNAMGLHPHKDILNLSYFFHWMTALDLQKYAESTTVPSVRKTRIAEIEIPILSLAEQCKIATILDKVSYLLALRKRQLTKLDELVKARFVEMFGDPYSNNKHWPVVKLATLFKIGSSKRIYQSEQVQNGVPFLRISDLMQKIRTGSADAELFISRETYGNLKENGLVPKPNDILITSRGTLGKCYVVTDQDEFYFQDGMISWLSDMDRSVAVGYITQLFLMEGFRKQIDDVPSGTTINYLSIDRLKNLDVMLPSIELQQHFVEFAAKICNCQLTIQQSLDRLEMLKKALMQEYFG